MNKIEKAVIECEGAWPSKAIPKISIGWIGPSYGEPHHIRFIDHDVNGKIESISKEIHKSEFMEARKRLENKPSWDDAPDWAGWLAQDRDGQWFWYEDEPAMDRNDHSWDSYSRLCKPKNSDPSHAFGDWRQSLERRPQRVHVGVDLADSPDVARALTIKAGKFEVRDSEGNLIYTAEEAKIDSKWKPGVDLPPVKTACEVHVRAGIWERCEILAHTEIPEGAGRQCAVFKVGDRVDCFDDPRVFRPIQSHHDKVIEAAHQALKGSMLMTPAHAIDRLLEHDMLKLPGDAE